MDPATRSLILELLGSHDNLTLATVRQDGWPQTTTVGYVNEGLTIYFACSPASQKIHNISSCNKVSLAIDRDEQDWACIRGLSMAATAEIVTDAEETAHIVDLMVAKFPRLLEFPAPSPGTIAFVRLTPKVISVLDYTKGFGHSDLVSV